MREKRNHGNGASCQLLGCSSALWLSGTCSDPRPLYFCPPSFRSYSCYAATRARRPPRCPGCAQDPSQPRLWAGLPRSSPPFTLCSSARHGALGARGVHTAAENHEIPIRFQGKFLSCVPCAPGPLGRRSLSLAQLCRTWLWVCAGLFRKACVFRSFLGPRSLSTSPGHSDCDICGPVSLGGSVGISAFPTLPGEGLQPASHSLSKDLVQLGVVGR